MFLPDPRMLMPSMFDGRKPSEQGMAIDWGNPLTRGLYHYHLFDRTGRQINLVNGSETESGIGDIAGEAIVDSARGRVYQRDRDSGTGPFVFSRDFKSDERGVTVVVGYKPGDTYIDHMLFDKDAGGFGSQDLLAWVDTANAGKLRLAMYAGTVAYGPDLDSQKGWNDFAMVSYGPTSGVADGYVNCEKVMSVVNIGSYSGAESGIATAANLDGTVPKNATGLYAYHMLYNRALTAPEIRALHQNPYQLLIPAS